MPFPAPPHRTRRALLTGASVSALAAGWASPAAAAAPRMFSQAWFAARVDATTGATAAPGSAAATLNQVTTANRNLATLARQLQAQQAAQAAASAAAASSIPNGLVLGGLQAAPGATPGSALWVGGRRAEPDHRRRPRGGRGPANRAPGHADLAGPSTSAARPI